MVFLWIAPPLCNWFDHTHYVWSHPHRLWEWCRVKEQMNSKNATRNDNNNKDKAQKNWLMGMVFVPYVHSWSFTNGRRKLTSEGREEWCTKIPCKQYEEVYVGETGRHFGVRMAEHRKEAEKTSIEQEFYKIHQWHYQWYFCQWALQIGHNRPCLSEQWCYGLISKWNSWARKWQV